MSKIIIENLCNFNIKRSDIEKKGFSVQKYDDVLRGKSSYKLDEIIALSEKFQLSLDCLILGKSATSVSALTQHEQQLIDDYRNLSAQGQEYIRQQFFMALQTYKKREDTSLLEIA